MPDAQPDGLRLSKDLRDQAEALVAKLDSWLCVPDGPGPVEAEIAFMRSCAALYDQLCGLDANLANDEEALEMLQAIAVDRVRPRVGSRMPSAVEGATPGLSIGTAEAVAAARLAASGSVREVMIATSIMSWGMPCAPWDHAPGAPGHLWVLPAICSALGPEEYFGRDALDSVPTAPYWYWGDKGTMWFRLSYEIRSLIPGLADDERARFREWAYEEWVWWLENHELSPDDEDPLSASTFDASITERAFEAAADARGLRSSRTPLSMEWVLRGAREDHHNSREMLQHAHLYYWSALESHLLLTASDDLDAVLQEHPWIARWYPEALEGPGSNADPLWPPDKDVLRRQVETRLARSNRSEPWARIQSTWSWEGAFNVESGFAVVTTGTDFPHCDCWDEALQAASSGCRHCGRPAQSQVATRAGGGDGHYPVCRISDGDGIPHGAIAVFDLGMAHGVGGLFAPSTLVKRSTPVYCGTMENTGSLSFCEATTGTDQPNTIISVALPPGTYHVVVWEGEDIYQALAVYDEAAMATLRPLVAGVDTTV